MDAAATERAIVRVRQRASALRSSAFYEKTAASAHEAWEAAAAAAAAAVGSSASSSTAEVSESQGRILCLGIGSVESSTASACQLALAWVLAEALGITTREWADPQMRGVDSATGNDLGFSVVDPTTALDMGAAAGSGPLLLFMPHCDRFLYERVLAANFASATRSGLAAEAASQMTQVVVLGNSFKVYNDRDELGVVPKGTPGAAPEDSLLRRLQRCTREQLLPEYDPCPEAFNDLAIITFSALSASEGQPQATSSLLS